MNCPHCGGAITESDRVCPYCGQDVSRTVQFPQRMDGQPTQSMGPGYTPPNYGQSYGQQQYGQNYGQQYGQNYGQPNTPGYGQGYGQPNYAPNYYSLYPQAVPTGPNNPALMWVGVALAVVGLLLSLCFIGVIISVVNDPESAASRDDTVLGGIICSGGLFFLFVIPGIVLFFVGRAPRR